MTEPQSLVGFLLARIEEDERPNRRCLCDCFEGSPRECEERWLAECEAKRRIITLHEQGSGWLGDPEPRGCLLCHENDGIIERFGWCETVRALALPYADHPDFRKEWAPRGPRADRGWDNDPPWEEWRH